MKLRFLLVPALLGASSLNFAGSLGSTSDETVTLTAGIQPLVQISNISTNSLNLGAYNGAGSGDLTGDLDFCVYSNTSGNLYDILADSTNGSGLFQLNGGGANTLTYNVEFDDAGTFSTAAATLADGTAAGGSFPGSSATNCGGSNNGSIRITVPEAGNLDSSPADTYTDTLTITVSPV